MSKLELSPAWRIYFKELRVLFAKDPEIKAFFDEENNTIRILVDDINKAEALKILLPKEKEFGNIKLNIVIIPPNAKSPSLTLTEKNIFDVAFKGNPVYAYQKTFEGVFAQPITYVIFKKEVVQIWIDNLGDINGLKSCLYEDLARDVFAPYDYYYYNTEKESTKTISFKCG